VRSSRIRCDREDIYPSEDFSRLEVGEPFAGRKVFAIIDAAQIRRAAPYVP
jgi:hypothetical protein